MGGTVPIMTPYLVISLCYVGVFFLRCRRFPMKALRVRLTETTYYTTGKTWSVYSSDLTPTNHRFGTCQIDTNHYEDQSTIYYI